MAILITGGCGYIGSHTAVELLSRGDEVVILDNLSNSCRAVLPRIEELSGRPVRFYEGDIGDRAQLDRVFAEQDIDTVVHFAGLKAVGESVAQPLTYYRNNIGGTVTLCEAMAAHGCRQIIFSSSATVYGSHNPSPYRETMPTGDVTNPYGRTKYIIEQLLNDLCASDASWSAVLLRYFNPIGAHPSGRIGEDPRGVPNNLMPYVAQVAVGRRAELAVFGNDYPTPDGTGVRDYLHVVDLARGHVCAVDYARAHTGAQAINLGTGQGHSVLELITTFERVNGVPVPYRFAPRRAGDLPAYYADPTLAQELLGWKAACTLEDMCRDTWRWQQQNPQGYAE